MGDTVGHALAMAVGFGFATVAGVTTVFVYEKIEKVFNNE